MTFDSLNLPKNGEALLFKGLFTPAESAHYFKVLRLQLEWKQEAIKLYGKSVMQPRLTAFYGDLSKSYKYSGITMHPKQWTNELLEIKNKIEKVSNTEFTSVLLNLYRDQKDSMGWHRDNEKVLGQNPVIGSVSFGATRRFELRHYYEKDLKVSVELGDGSFLLMRGETQHYWEHQVAKTKSLTLERMNLTFRKILEPAM